MEQKDIIASFVVNGEAYNAFDNDFDNPQEFYKMLEKTEKCSTFHHF